MTLKKVLAFALSIAMVMSMIPAGLVAFAEEGSVVATIGDNEYTSLAEAMVAVSEMYDTEAVEVTLVKDSGEDFTLEYGVAVLNTEGNSYRGTATVTDAVLITDCELEDVVCNLKGSNSDKTKFGYAGLEAGVETVEGAQVRIGGGKSEGGKVVGEDSGLRFVATANLSDTLAAIAYGFFDSEEGEYAEGYEIGMKVTAEGSNSATLVPATLWQEEGRVFTAALTNLKETNFNRRYTAKAYVCVEGVVFEDVKTSTRSIYQVASGLLSRGENADKMSNALVGMLNAYVNQTGVRLTLTDANEKGSLDARLEDKTGGYTGDAFFTVGDTTYKNGKYSVTLEAVGRSIIDTRIFNEYVRINNNNSKVSPVTGVTDNGNGTYTVTFDYADMDGMKSVINEAVSLTSGKVTAVVPEGVQFTGSADKLSLVLKTISDDKSAVEAGEGEELDSFDIHVMGIAEGNVTPVIVTFSEMAEKGLNRGNLRLYHVEDGVNVEMEQVEKASDLKKHNQFAYDPVDGTVVMALASFSEVAVVSTDAKWEGKYATGFAGGTGTETDPYIIANADQLAYFSAAVGGMGVDKDKKDFADEYVKLVNDIDLNGSASETDGNYLFYPIGYYNSTDSYAAQRGVSGITSNVSSFSGTFDGNGHTISNFYQNTWEMFGDYNDGYTGTPNYYKDAMGLFGYVVNGKVCNLTVENFSSDGEFTPTGVIAAYAVNSTFENIAITNCNPRVYNTGNGGIVGIGGNSDDPDTYKLTFTNITIDNTNKITALWGSWDVACGGLVGMFRGAGHAWMTNCHVAAQIDVYNDVCGNYQYYWYRYSGMMIGTNKNMTTDDKGYTVPETDKFHATGCTVHFGDWNNYWYCELVDNSLASYTHDHQFSRLTQVEAVNGTTITYLDGTTGTVPTSGRANYVVVKDSTKAHSTENAECYHFKNGEVWNHETAGTETVDGATVLKEDKQHVYLPFNQLFTGYGWGVKHVPVYNGEDYAFEGITILDREEADSEVKFEKADTAKDSYATGATVTIGELFKAATTGVDANNAIKGDKVQVTVSPADENSTVTGVYAPNTTDWTQGTLTFSGAGAAKITITDYYFCTPTTITVTVTEKVAVEKFETKFTGDFLYRVGNQNAVKLGSLFAAKEGAEIGTVTIEVENVSGTEELDVYTKSSTWTNGTLDFAGYTGVVKVTIKDDDTYCKPTELMLEVVDAVNSTGATNADSGNVVLLNNCGVSSMNVSGDYTFYGNGFTMTYSGNGQYLRNGLKHGVVTVSENGTLDNLKIKASIYPEAYLYYGTNNFGKAVQDGPSDGNERYYYQLSAVAASGNATISNCYIYGGRNNVFVDTGDVIIKDSVLECGTVANVQIVSNRNHTVTLENLTTIQHQTNPTLGDTSLVMLGAGVLVGPETNDNPTIVLNGEMKQYNWVTAEDAEAVSNNMAKAIINGALNATAYNHTVNGKTASNLGIIYMNTYDTEVDNKTDLPYVMGDVSMKVSGNPINGKVCSLQGATADQIYSDYANADKATINGLYKPQFSFDGTLGGQEIAKGGDEHCYVEDKTVGVPCHVVDKTVNVMFPAGELKDLDLATLVNVERYTGQDLNLKITCTDENGNDVAVDDGKVTLYKKMNYTVTYTVTNTLVFDANGEKVADVEDEYSRDIALTVSLKDKATPNAEFAFDSTKQIMGYGKKSGLSGLGKNNFQYLPFLAGMQIYDYNGQTKYLRFDGNTDFSKIAKVELTCASDNAYVTVTLTDGGVIYVDFFGRADSGSSTKTGAIQTNNNTVYYLTDGDTSATTTTWKITKYAFVGNNGVEITDKKQVFTNCVSGTLPSNSFGTTIKYTVTYDANEGSCGQTVGYATSASAAVTLPTPTRSGYIFAGWYTAASGGTRVGGAGASYTPTSNITLYAQWGEPSTVTYNANGGTCDTASEKYTGTALTLPMPTRDGYWFTGWYDAATGGKKIGNAGTAYNPTGSVTLYAQWSPVYTVTYNANGGSVTPASAEYKGTALTLPMPTRDGYAFNGWYTAASGGTKVEGPYTPSTNITLYAQWKAPATVTYDATTNGGSCSTTSQTYLGTALTLPTPTARTGYTFKGWYTAASGGTKIGDAGASYTPDANITLYAQWTINSYTVKVTTSNATVTGVTNGQSIEYGTTVSVTVKFDKNNSRTFTVKNDTTGENILNKDTAGTYTFTMPASNVTINASSSGCFAEGTLITLADGTQKPIEEITFEDELLAWDFNTGSYATTSASLIETYEASETRVINLQFEDGTVVRMVADHGFFDKEANKFVFVEEANVDSYIGHDFVKVAEDGTYEAVKLTGYEVTVENVSYYTIQTAIYNNCIAENMFTLTSPPEMLDNDGWFDYFEIGDNMKYDEAKKQADIEKYGLYEYEEFAEYVTYEQFIAFNGPYLKVLVGKGIVTYEELIDLIGMYVNPANE